MATLTGLLIILPRKVRRFWNDIEKECLIIYLSYITRRRCGTMVCVLERIATFLLNLSEWVLLIFKRECRSVILLCCMVHAAVYLLVCHSQWFYLESRILQISVYGCMSLRSIYIFVTMQETRLMFGNTRQCVRKQSLPRGVSKNEDYIITTVKPRKRFSFAYNLF